MDNNRNQFIEQNKIQEVLDCVNIVELISNYVNLKKAGVNHKGLCPFHSEKTPSFVVSEQKQMFHCFGCGAGGNAIKFFMDIERKSFPEAIKELAEKNGVIIEEYELSPEEQKKKKQYERFIAINKVTAEFFEHNLWNSPEGKKALSYLYKRQLKDETIKKFGLGYAIDDWQRLKEFLKSKKVTEKEMLALGLLSQNQDGSRTFDKFRGRLIFPIYDSNSHVVAFGGRITDKGEPKYLNSPDTPVYNKGRHLYGMHIAKHEIRKKDRSILAEGYMDVLLCHQFEVTEAVASLGTAFTESQGKMLLRYSINNHIAYDGDEAGRNAAIRAMEVMRDLGIKTKAVLFPTGYDPDDFLLKEGKEKFEELLESAQDPVIFKLEFLMNDDVADLTEKNKIIEQLAQDIFKIQSTIIRDDIIRKVSSRLGLKEDLLRSELRLLYNNKENRTKITDRKYDNQKVAQPHQINKDQAFVLQKLCEDPDLLADIEKRGGIQLFDKELQDIYLSVANHNNSDIIKNRSELNEKIVSCVMLQDLEFEDQHKAFEEILNKLCSTKLEKDFQEKQKQLALAEKNSDTEQMMAVLGEIESIIKNKDRIRRGLFN